MVPFCLLRCVGLGDSSHSKWVYRSCQKWYLPGITIERKLRAATSAIERRGYVRLSQTSRTRNAATDQLLSSADPDCGGGPDVSHSAEDDANGRNSPGSPGCDICNRAHPLPPVPPLDRTRVLALEAIIQLVESGPGGFGGHDRGGVFDRV